MSVCIASKSHSISTHPKILSDPTRARHRRPNLTKFLSDPQGMIRLKLSDPFILQAFPVAAGVPGNLDDARRRNDWRGRRRGGCYGALDSTSSAWWHGQTGPPRRIADHPLDEIKQVAGLMSSYKYSLSHRGGGGLSVSRKDSPAGVVSGRLAGWAEMSGKKRAAQIHRLRR